MSFDLKIVPWSDKTVAGAPYIVHYLMYETSCYLTFELIDFPLKLQLTSCRISGKKYCL